MSKFKNFLVSLKDHTIKGYKWLGVDGIINLETSALLVIIFNLIFSQPLPIFFTTIIMLIKSIIDKKNGHIDETHDFICACIGIVLGFIIGLK
jgi:hypothetical protein